MLFLVINYSNANKQFCFYNFELWPKQFAIKNNQSLRTNTAQKRHHVAWVLDERRLFRRGQMEVDFTISDFFEHFFFYLKVKLLKEEIPTQQF